MVVVPTPTADLVADLGQREQLVLGVSWPDRTPYLDLARVRDFARTRLPLHGRLGWRVVAPGRWCTGWYGFDRRGEGQRWPCPDQNPAGTGRQCADCGLRDQFRFAHQGHLGGYVPAALEAYLGSPHWLYLATFADGFTKVGTASDSSRTSRLDEQGPRYASYLARAANGRLVREAEDEVTRRLEVPQHRRRAAKAAAFARPAPPAVVHARHAETVAQAAELVAAALQEEGLAPVDHQWHPAEAMRLLHAPPPSGSRLVYPHPLGEGEHGLHIEAVAGPAALARTDPAPDALRYVVDLGSLTGCRVVVGDFTSAEAELQETLF